MEPSRQRSKWQQPASVWVSWFWPDWFDVSKLLSPPTSAFVWVAKDKQTYESELWDWAATYFSYSRGIIIIWENWSSFDSVQCQLLFKLFSLQTRPFKGDAFTSFQHNDQWILHQEGKINWNSMSSFSWHDTIKSLYWSRGTSLRACS